MVTDMTNPVWQALYGHPYIWTDRQTLPALYVFFSCTSCKKLISQCINPYINELELLLRVTDGYNKICRDKYWRTVLPHLNLFHFRCLEESKWDVKKAITVFTELYKMSKIPPEAFSNL
jgi:hypothetical protein